MDHKIPVKRPDVVLINKKKITCPLVDFAVLADYRVKIKEVEKRDKITETANYQSLHTSLFFFKRRLFCGHSVFTQTNFLIYTFHAPENDAI